MRARGAPVQNILLVFDLDILLPGFDYRTIRIGPSQAFVQIGMVRLILQLSRNLEWGRLGSGTSVRAKEVAESEVGISQLCLRVEKFWPLIGKSHFSALHVQFADNAGAETLLLALEVLVQDPHRILTHPHFRPIQEKFVKRDPHIHCHPAGNLLQLIILLLDIQPRDGHLARYCSASIKILVDPQRRIVIFLPECGLALLLSFIVQPARG